MDQSHSRRPFPIAASLTLVAVLASSCEREKSGARDEGWNPQAKSYLDEAAAKEASNTRKGWVHVEGKGYHYDKPEGWTESKDMQEGVYFLLKSPTDDLTIQMTSRYIESIPEGVHDLRDWARLQYSSMGMPEALEETREVDVADGDALEARVTMRGSHLRVRYFVDIFQNPEHQRMWFLTVASKEKSRLDSPEVQGFLDKLRVGNFRWVD